ncbi:MAG: hypothetical protein AB1529_00665 [Candidatus Micrarchaeota archaeon]
MKEIEVEGYTVTIERAFGRFVVSVPKLPGCTVQVDREEDAGREIRKQMGMYFSELASKKPKEKPGGDERSTRATVKIRK